MTAFRAGATAEEALLPVLARVYHQQLQPVLQQWTPGLAHPERLNLTTLPAAVERVAQAANRLGTNAMDQVTQSRVGAFRTVATSWLSLSALTVQYEADRTAGHPRHVLTWESAARTAQRLVFQELPAFMRTFADRPLPSPEGARSAASAVTPERAYNGQRLPQGQRRAGKPVRIPAEQRGRRQPPRAAPGGAVPEP
jgi:hypothetical protein